MNKKMVIILMSIFILTGTIFLISSNKEKNINKNKDEVVTSLLEQVSNQININSKLDKIAKSNKYTFENAYVDLNPYGISPLSAIIIFKTKTKESVELKINGTYKTTMEEANEHVIPIYGLLENTSNTIELKMGNKIKEYRIKTSKSGIKYPLEVETKSEKVNNENLYFTVSSLSTYFTGWDSDGNIRFYLTVDNRMDVEWLNNGHFLIGTSQGQYAENFAAFVEMDYLGKIYNYYVPSNGYSFEFQVLNNGNYMLAGGDKPVYINEQLIYELNPKTGEKTSSLNIAQVIKEIDPNFNSLYLGQKAIRNAFVYNELTGEVIVSLRGLDAIISFDYNNKKLNWVFTNPNNELFKNELWKPYLVTLKSGRYPMGQHSVILTKDGNLAFFNNGYNRLHGFENGGQDLVSAYKDNYSSAEIYNIQNKEATLIRSFDENKLLFSHQYGSIKETLNGNYIVDFGYNLKDDYRMSKTGKLSEAENDVDKIYATIIEYDKTGNILFKAKTEEGKYRAFKHELYSSKTNNMIPSKLTIFNKIPKDKFRKLNITNDIRESSDWIYTCTITQNTFNTNYDIQNNDDIKLLFVKDSDVYEFTYKDGKSKINNRIFNYQLSTGKYHLYIKLNGNIYNAHKIVQY